MLNSFPVCVIVGIALGFLSGLGIGGGSLLLLWLSVVLNMDPISAKEINLLFFLPSAIVASIFRWKQNKIDWNIWLRATVAGCIAAGLCSWLSTVIQTSILKTIFGVLLIITGVREIFYRPRKAK
jgi:hypothetical protein